MHLLRAATTWQLELRFDGIYTRKQAIEMIRARSAAVGAGQWVFNIGGWATAQFADEAKAFTREELDRIAPNNPVALQESYYQVFLNSRGLEAFGIREGAPDPEDFIKGSIQRDAAGRPTGVIKGDIAATRPVAARLPRVAPAQLEASTRALVADMNRVGLTTFGVAGCVEDVLADHPEVEGAAATRRSGVLHRRRGGRHARAGGPVDPSDRPDAAVPGR